MKFSAYLFCSLTISCMLSVSSCGPKAEGNDGDVYVLKSKETELCISQGIDSSLVKLIRQNCRAEFEIFVPDSVWSYDMDNDSFIVRASQLQGLMYESEMVLAQDLVERYGADCITKGHTMYVYEQNFGLGDDKDKVAIVNTSDKYKILEETATDGINYDIDNDSVISIIRGFDTQLNLTLTGAGLDWCQFSIGKAPADWDAFAENVYAVCPDVVDQGTGSIEELASEMKRTNTLYLWWD